jgi:hypothetical protein
VTYVATGILIATLVLVVQSRFAFWDAVVDRTSHIEDLTIRVHVKPKEESHD